MIKKEKYQTTTNTHMYNGKEVGAHYDIPIGVDENLYYEIINECIDLVKRNGLTIRQARNLFMDCSDMVLDCDTFDSPAQLCEFDKISKYLKDIAMSLRILTNCPLNDL